MGEHRRHAVRMGRWVAIITAVSTALIGLSAMVTAIAVARVVVTPPRRRSESTRILSVRLFDTPGQSDGGGTVTFSRTADSMLAGDYGIFFAGETGHARIGAILEATPTRVTRALIAVDSGDLQHANRCRFSGWFYTDPSELGIGFSSALIATDRGPAPAWLFPAAVSSADNPGSRWVIQIHGRAVRRQECLRAVPIFHDGGFTCLVVSYRNDGDAPESADGRYGLGDSEWADVDAALHFAVEHGADDIVLMGWSMGGATALQAFVRSPVSPLISGIVLESPVVDWRAALFFQGQKLGLPKAIRSTVLMLIASRWSGFLTGQNAPIDLNALDFVNRASELTVPVLLLHSRDDGYIPIGPSRALADARPDIVTFEEFSGAAHTKLWNHDPERWNTVISRWLRGLADGQDHRD